MIGALHMKFHCDTFVPYRTSGRMNIALHLQMNYRCTCIKEERRTWHTTDKT